MSMRENPQVFKQEETNTECYGLLSKKYFSRGRKIYRSKNISILTRGMLYMLNIVISNHILRFHNIQVTVIYAMY
jgi:hypothetical protein